VTPIPGNWQDHLIDKSATCEELYLDHFLIG
jgi:hypothetical protein